MIYRIENPATRLWSECLPLVEANHNTLATILQASAPRLLRTRLLDSPVVTAKSIVSGAEGRNVILDITTLPKRHFLFAVKRLLEDSDVKTFVVCYARAGSYSESPLCEDALPPCAIPGFAREDLPSDKRRLIVGVGYVALSVDEIVGDAKHPKLDFVFPFPPSSPAFRRNWALLSNLIPQEYSADTKIHRVHGMDAFEVYDRVRNWGATQQLDLIPLGPKPHALGMALACLSLGGTAELIYPQPQAYRPDYSSGFATDSDGRPVICGYCLKKDGVRTF